MTTSVGWHETPIGDIAHVISGYAFKSESFRNEGIPVIKIKNIRFGYVDLSNAQFVEKRFLSLDEKYHVRGGDLLISLTGSHLSQPNSVVGRVASHSKLLGHCLLNQRAGKVIIDEPNRCDKEFLFYLLSSADIRREIALLAHGAASQANVSPKQIERLTICLPPLETQRKISAVLSAYDDLIENNTRRIAILEEMAQALYREWFVHFRFPGHDTQQVPGTSEVPGTLSDASSEQDGRLPEGWEIVPFSDIAVQIRNNIKPYQFESEVFAHYSFPAFDTTHMPAFEVGKSIRSNKYEVPMDVVLLSKLNPRIPRIWLPVVDEYENQSICSTEFLVLHPNEMFTAPYVFALCSSRKFLDEFAGLALGTSTSHQRVKPNDLLKMKVIKPKPDIVSSFSQIVGSIFTLIHNLRLKNANLRQTRDLLLPRLISGELDVSRIKVPGTSEVPGTWEAEVPGTYEENDL